MGTCCGTPNSIEKQVTPLSGSAPITKTKLRLKALQFTGYYKLELAKLLPKVQKMMQNIRANSSYGIDYDFQKKVEDIETVYE